jgi:putative tryptophan/tyrosine transport system substrate-binding protein
MPDHRLGPLKTWAAVVVVGLLAAVWLPGCRQAESDVPVMGFFQIVSNSALDTLREGFVQGLREGGYEDGRNLRIIFKNAEGDISTAQLIARDFVNRHVDIIGLASTQSLQAAMQATETTPIIFCGVVDPYILGAGVTAENHRPNITGIYNPLPVDEGMRLVVQSMPEVRRIGTLFDPSEAFAEIYQRMGRETALELGVEWVEIPVSGPNEITNGIQALSARGVEAIMQVPSNTVYSGIDGAIRAASNAGLPVFSVDVSHVEKGALAAVGADFFQAGLEAGHLAARVLDGVSPADIPFAPVQRQQLLVNAEEYRRHNLAIPVEVLQRADEVLGEPALTEVQ